MGVYASAVVSAAVNEVIAIKRLLSMHIRFVERAHAVRQTDSVFFFAIYVVPITASAGDVLASIHCRLFYRYRGKYLHKLHPVLITFLAVYCSPTSRVSTAVHHCSIYNALLQCNKEVPS